MPAFAVVVFAHAMGDVGRDLEPDDVGKQRMLAARMQLFAQGEHHRHQQHGLVARAIIVEILGVPERAVGHRRIDRIGLDARTHHS